LWNRGEWDEGVHPWLTEFRALVRPYRAAAGPFPAGDDAWREALEATRLFAPLASAEFEHVHRVSPDDFVALVASWSWIANVPEPERAGVLARVRELARGDAEVRLRYRTEVHWTRRG
jgi:hypothetical protein